MLNKMKSAFGGKKLLVSLLLIGVVASAVAYGTYSYFSDTETVADNLFHAGTIDIEEGNYNEGPFVVADMKPCTVHYMQMEITNVGENEADVWKRLVNFRYEDGSTPEPEPGDSDNQIGAVIRYDMEIDGQVVIRESDGYVLDTGDHQLDNTIAINGYWMYLGRMLPGQVMAVDQSYHMDSSTDNWAQGDEMTFDVELFAQQIVGGAPSPTGELGGLERCQADNGIAEEYNIGTGEDADHNLIGWSNVWDWGGNYGGGDDGTLRLLTGFGDSCDEGFEEAEFTMHADDKYAVQLTLHHLDGSQDDSYDVYAKIEGVWTKFGHYEGQTGSESWVTTTFNLPVPLTGDVEFKLVATVPNPDWCANWGQVAFSWAQLVYNTCLIPSPTPI
ncbi:SipW-dependent-type signal peptide-containing protein [Patescibacteria group bacterium]|nr:SipW-dependent-type signal peptide-containing protein [Patescibacteria group bacterium]